MQREDGKQKLRKISREILKLIYSIATKDKTTPRDYLALDITNKIEELGEISPSLETIKRHISTARNSKNPLEKKWTIAACAEYPSYFPPESILDISKIQKETDNFLSLNLLDRATKADQARINDDMRKLFEHEVANRNAIDEEYSKIFGRKRHEMSIREAMWFVRLKPLITDMLDNFQPVIPDANMELFKDMRYVLLLAIAQIYAFEEMTSDLLNEVEFDTSELDEAIYSKNLEKLLGMSLGKVLPQMFNQMNQKPQEYKEWAMNNPASHAEFTNMFNALRSLVKKEDKKE